MRIGPSESVLAAAVWGLVAAALLGIAILALAGLLASGPGPAGIALQNSAGHVILGRKANTRNHLIAFTVADGRGLFIQETRIKATEWPVLTYSVDLPRGLEAAFVWEREKAAGAVHEVILPRDGTALLLGEEETWQGRLERIGLLVRRDPNSLPGLGEGSGLVRASVALNKPGPTQLWAVLATRWTAFRGWDGRSINHLGDSWLPAILAGWVSAGALIAFVLHGPARQRAGGVALVAGLATGWLLLHLLWLRQLGLQSVETHERFGKSDFASALAQGRDYGLVSFAEEIREALAKTGRIEHLVIVSDDRYFGERSRYLLLPYPATHFRSLGQLSSNLDRLHSGHAVIGDSRTVPAIDRMLAEHNVAFSVPVRDAQGVLYVLEKG